MTVRYSTHQLDIYYELQEVFKFLLRNISAKKYASNTYVLKIGNLKRQMMHHYYHIKYVITK